jgi:hypothetical protein
MTPPRPATLPRFTQQRSTAPARSSAAPPEPSSDAAALGASRQRAQRVRDSLPRLAARWCAARQRVAHAKVSRLAGWQVSRLAG